MNILLEVLYSTVEIRFYPKQNNKKLKFGQCVLLGINSHQEKIPINSFWENGFLGPNPQWGTAPMCQNFDVVKNACLIHRWKDNLNLIII